MAVRTSEPNGIKDKGLSVFFATMRLGCRTQ